MNKKVMASPLCFVNTCCLHLKVSIWPKSDLDDVLWFSLKYKVKAPSPWQALHNNLLHRKGSQETLMPRDCGYMVSISAISLIGETTILVALVVWALGYL